MHLFCLLACIGVAFISSTFAEFQELTKLTNEGRQEVTSIEGRLDRLEQELGINAPPQKMSFNVFGDFLLWKASLDGVAHATTAVLVTDPDGGIGLDRFKTRTVHFEYDPGFQVGIGMGLPYDKWDLSAVWRSFHTTGKDKARGALSEEVGNRIILDSIGMLEELFTPANKAMAKCAIDLDVIDFTLGRRFVWSRYFVFRPFAGLRLAWVDLDWDISFTRPFNTPSPIPLTSASLDVDNTYKAVGFLGGFESKWTLYKGFGLFSFVTASLIYGESSEGTKEKFSLIPAMSMTRFEQTLKAHNSTHTVKGVFDIALGLKWEIQFKKRCGLLLRAGYEFFYWPNVTQKTVVQSTRIRDRSDLSFQGLIVGAKFNY